MRKKVPFFKRKSVLFFLLGSLIALIMGLSGNKAIQATNTDEFCASCHNVHPHSVTSWKMSTHYDNKSGVVVHCVECHLPPAGHGKLPEKVKTGLRDVYGTIFKDVKKLNWEQKSSVEFAVHHTFEESCIKCHQNLFP